VTAISAVIPCRNEADCIGDLLDDLARQTLNVPFTVVIADGMSDDGTWELLQRRQAEGRDPFQLILVRNPDRTIPHALNRAVQAAPDGLIIRVDAHGRIPVDFLARMAEALADSPRRLVGPRIRMHAGSPGAMATTIALILNSPIGNGGTPSRGGVAIPRPVAHTVMSCWHRQVWVDNGGFDESLLSNEDFDFDWRARARGCEVLSLPAPEYGLTARAALGSLARQRWRYGWWKAVVLRRHPTSLHLRQMLPPLALIAAVPLAVCAPLGLACCALMWLLLVLALTFHVIRREKPTKPLATLLLSPAVAGVVQFVWAAGLIAGLACNRPGAPRLVPPAGPLDPPVGTR
jgi:succinoglycan biosynthesis protein ExoA